MLQRFPRARAMLGPTLVLVSVTASLAVSPARANHAAAASGGAVSLSGGAPSLSGGAPSLSGGAPPATDGVPDIGQTLFTNGDSLPEIRETAPTLATWFFDRPDSYSWAGSIGDGWATTPFVNYRSYASFAADLARGEAPDVPLVFYDPEPEAATPGDEQRRPRTYMGLFAELAHRHGYRVVNAPALGLLAVPGGECVQRPEEMLVHAYLRCGFPAAAAKGADGVELQIQSDQCEAFAFAGRYADEVLLAAEAARRVNPAVAVYSGLSTGKCSPSGEALFHAWGSVAPYVNGHFINVTRSNAVAAADLFGLISPFAIHDGGFGLSSVVSGQGVTVTWRVDPAAQQPHELVDATGLSLFHSGRLARDGTFRHRFDAAGSYAVTDGATGQRADVEVPVVVSPSSGGTATRFLVRAAIGDAPLGFVVQTQIWRPGALNFAPWRAGARNLFVAEAEADPGIYAFRARLLNKATGAASGWSAFTRIVVTQ